MFLSMSGIESLSDIINSMHNGRKIMLVYKIKLKKGYRKKKRKKEEKKKAERKKTVFPSRSFVFVFLVCVPSLSLSAIAPLPLYNFVVVVAWFASLVHECLSFSPFVGFLFV